MISRRRILQLAAVAPLRAADVIGYREYSRCLPDYLTGLAGEAYRRRLDRIAKLSPQEYQKWARETFLKLAGPLPARTPLNVRTVGAFERERYRVEKLVYETRPGLIVTANLYLPKANGLHPGVLFQMGHATNGKASVTYQRCCQGLVQLGYVVLAFDPMGQGERATGLPSADDEHTVPGRLMLLTGETATGMQLWDAMRSLDVLESHPQVDRTKLASAGQSGGGTLTMMLAAADARLASAAVSSGNTENFATLPFVSPGSTDDAEQDLVGSGPLGFDRWDMLWPIAPKPLLVGTSARDFFGTYSPSYEKSNREEYARLAHAYEVMGARDRLGQVETPLPHGLSYSLRVSTYAWFERYLKGSRTVIAEEPPTSPEEDRTLWCGATGDVVRDFGGKTVSALIRERAAGIQTPEHAADLGALLGIEKSGGPLLVKAKTRYAACEIQAVEVNSAAQVWVPAWLFLPKRDWTKLLVLLDPKGRNVQWHEDELYARLAGAGVAVCAMDVRGIGDLQPSFSEGAVGYTREHQSEENYAWASLILGRSLLGQRVSDLLAMSRALMAAFPQASVLVAARDRMTAPALCAAAIETRIQKVHLTRPLKSWRSLVESEQYDAAQFASFVPDILRHTDLPQITKSIAPRPVMMADAAWDFDTLRRFCS